MDRQESNNERRVDEQGMMILPFEFPFSPRDEFVHHPRGVERRRCLKDDADTSAVLIEGFDVVGMFLVLAAMTLIAWRKLQQYSVELFDVILAQGNVRPGIEDHLGGFRVAGDFLLVTRAEGVTLEVGKQSFDLLIGELDAFNAGRRGDALNGGDVAQGKQALRGEGAQGFPFALELIDLGDEQRLAILLLCLSVFTVIR